MKKFFNIIFCLSLIISMGACGNKERSTHPDATNPPKPVASSNNPQAVSTAYTPVVTPNGTTLPWKMVDGVKEFNLTVEEIEWEIAPGMKIKAWGYNGRTPGPTIEAVEGDKVRIYVTNKLKEPTAVHWHGIILPSGMDGVKGLNQKGILPGETFKYEFTLNQHGTQMYHSHGDEMVQMGMGAMGFFIIHPKKQEQKIDRDYAIFLNEWFVQPGTSKPNTSVMTDFNLFTFNSRAYPGTEALIAKTGERVRIRVANVGQESHPIHLHGHSFKIIATDGGDIPESAQWPETTVVVFPGQTRDVEFIANAGDWALHCHRRHHPMNQMGHDIPNMLGVSQKGLEEKVRKQAPGYMAMGEHGMDEMMDMGMPGPKNTLPMGASQDGPFGSTGMGGMFTILKVRDKLEEGKSPEWYKNPQGTVASPVNASLETQSESTSTEGAIYTCPMHPEVQSKQPGNCPICGMKLVPQTKDKKIPEKKMPAKKMDMNMPMDHSKMKMK